MDRDEMIGLFAQVMAGLAVPYSISGPTGALAQAGPAWANLSAGLGFGWRDAAAYEKEIRRVLDGEKKGDKPCRKKSKSK